MLVDLFIRKHKEVLSTSVQIVKTRRDVTCHFQMLNLIATDRNKIGIEHQDVGGHQDRVAKKPHRNPGIGIGIGRCIGLDASLVRMSPIHQAFSTDAI